MNKKARFSFNDINFLSRSFQQSRIFLTGFELRIFTVLGEEEKSSNQIAKTIKADPRATDRLLNALCVTGAVKKKNGMFSNSEAAKQYLVEGKPEYQGGLMHSVNLWDSWSNLSKSVKAGRSVKINSVEERGDKWFKPFIAAMHNRAFSEAPSLIEQIDLSGVKKVLDVGGGSGAYSIAFVKAGDDICSTVFDLPNVVSMTENYIRDAGLEGKIDTALGDYNTDELPSGYDLVFLSAIIHINSPEQNIELINKSSRALNSGGMIVISDFIMDDDRIHPSFGAFFALNMLVNTDSGDTYTESEVKDWLEQAGMTFVERKETRSTGLIIGRKVE
ncbi:MAG: methyltransferase [Desulfobacteraceae bacterium]|jgi:SAM-dependent methyltransferase